MGLAVLRSRPSAALLRLGIPALAGAAGVAGAAYFLLVHAPRQRTEALAALGRDLAFRAEVSAQAVDQWALSVTQDAGALALEPEAIGLASGLGGPPAARHFDSVLTAYVRTHPAMRAMVFDARLRVVARSRGAGLLDEGDRRAVRRALAGSAVVDFDAAPSGPEVAVAVPVRASAPGGGAPIGAVLLEANPKDWLYPFFALRPLDAPSAEAVLVQREGDSALFLTPLRFSSAPPLTVRRSLRTPGFAALAALGGGSQVGAFVDYRGVPVYAFTRRLTEAPWGLVVKVDQSDALAADRKRLKSQGLFWLGLYGIFTAFLGAIWWGARQALAVGSAEAQARTALLLDQASDAFLFVDFDGRITGANRRAEEFYGYPPGALVGKHVVTELRPEDEREPDRWPFKTAYREGRLLLETVHVSASGEPLPVEVSSALVSVGDERSLVWVVRDIRERRTAEERIRRLSRALRMTANVNRLIVREGDAKQLFQEACRILVEDGGFQMAWVGVEEPDGRVRPLASAGDSDGCLANVELRWDDSPAGQGPTGTAIREDRTVAHCELAPPGAPALWREATAATGLRSGASCPIRKAGVVAGALTVYSAEPAVFDAEMLALLEESAGDLGFALQAIEDRTERERSETALRESENVLRWILKSMINAFVLFESVFDDDGHFISYRFVYVNDACERITGVKNEEVRDKRVHEVWPGTEPEWIKRYGEVAVTGVPQTFDMYHDPTRKLYHCNVYRPWDTKDRFCVIFEDITERKRAEEALRESELMLKEAQRIGRIGCWEFVLATREVRWSEMVYVLYERDPARGPPTSEEEAAYYSPEDAERLRRLAQTTIETGEPYEAEVVVKLPGGRVRHLAAAGTPIKDESGRVTRLLGTVQDITERKRAERSLRAERDRNQKYLEVVGGVLLALDRDGKVALINQAGSRLLGFEEGSLVGRDWFDACLPPRVCEDVRAVIRCVMAGDIAAVEHHENPVLTRSGEERLISWHNALVLDESGMPAWTLSSGIDITDQRRAEEALGRLNAELERRVAERTAELESFSYSVSHDLRAPLAVIEGFARILRTEHARQLDEEGRRLVDVVCANTQKTAQLIEGLLALSRVGSHELSRERVDMGALAAAAWGELVPPDEREAIRFAVGELPDAVADASLVRQVWVNLLDNALKFTAPKGDRAVEVGARTAPGRTTYFVKDNGVGFDPVDASKLFGAFERLHSARDFPGTGVGLAIVQRIVHRHGGEVSAEGAVGEGATFRFSLPNSETDL